MVLNDRTFTDVSPTFLKIIVAKIKEMITDFGKNLAVISSVVTDDQPLEAISQSKYLGI